MLAALIAALASANAGVSPQPASTPVSYELATEINGVVFTTLPGTYSQMTAEGDFYALAATLASTVQSSLNDPSISVSVGSSSDPSTTNLPVYAKFTSLQTVTDPFTGEVIASYPVISDVVQVGSLTVNVPSQDEALQLAQCDTVYGPWKTTPGTTTTTSDCNSTTTTTTSDSQSRTKYKRCMFNGTIVSCTVDTSGDVSDTFTPGADPVVNTSMGGDSTLCCATGQSADGSSGASGSDSGTDPNSDCSTCSTDNNGDPTMGSIHFTIPTGLGRMGGKPGFLRVDQVRTGKHLFTPAILENQSDAGTEIIRAPDYTIRQVASADRILNVEVLSPSKFRVSTYERKPDAKPDKETGLYSVSGKPLRVQEIENPNPEGEASSLIYRNMLGENKIDETRYTWNAELNVWTMSRGNGLSVETLATHEDPKTGDLIEERIIADAKGQHARKTVVQWHKFAFGNRVVRRVNDPEGAKLTETLDYYTDASERGRYGHLRAWVHPNGSWQAFDYDEDGRVSQSIRPWKDSPVGSKSDEAKATLTEYPSMLPSHADYQKRHQLVAWTTSVLGVSVERRFSYAAITSKGERIRIQERAASPVASFGDAGALRSMEYLGRARKNDPLSERVIRRISEDGRTETYSYELGTYLGVDDAPGDFKRGLDGQFVQVTKTEIPAGHTEPVSGRSRQTVTIEDVRGNVVLETQYLLTPKEWVLTSWQCHAYDGYGKRTSTRTEAGVIAEYRYAPCCSRLEWERTQDGAETQYEYDPLGRLTRTTRKAPGRASIVTIRKLDPHGQALEETTEAGSLRTITLHAYDSAGRLIQQNAPGGFVTKYAYPDPLTREVTLSSGATQISLSYLDGQSRATYGTAVVRQEHDYGVEAATHQLWSETRTGGAQSPRWQRQFTNALGQQVLAQMPAAAGNKPNTTVQRYDAHGHLVAQTRDGATSRLTEVDEATGTVTEGEDLDGDGKLDPLKDRVTRRESTLEKRGDQWWQVGKVYASTGDQAKPLRRVSTQRMQITGLGTAAKEGTLLLSQSEAEDPSGRVIRSITLLETATGRHIQSQEDLTSHHRARRVMEGGLLVESAEQDGEAPEHLVSYHYDELGRKTSQKDATTGAEHTLKLDAETGKSLEETAPGGAVTRYAYYTSGLAGAGQLKTVTDAAGHEKRFAYNARGEKLAEWGDAVYPIAYEHNRFGEQSAMCTLRASDTPKTDSLAALSKTFSSSESSLTTWHRDTATGVLLGKEYADGKGTHYSYDAQGHLKERIWARGVGTKHDYDAVGHLESTTYTDGTAPVRHAKHDVLARPTEIEDGFANYVKAYNAEGRIEDEITRSKDAQVPGWTIHRSYDSAGRPTGYTLIQLPATPDAPASVLQQISSSYDAQGRLDTITDCTPTANQELGTESHKLQWKYSYSTLFSKQVETIIGPAFTTKNILDSKRGHLITKEQKGRDGTMLASYTYGVNALGQRERLEATGIAHAKPLKWDWTYNSRGELTKAGEAARQWDYAYDTIGNRLRASIINREQKTENRELTYTSNALNQYMSTSTNVSVVKPAYDADGNMLSDGAHTCTWDAENQLTTLTQSKLTVTNTYDALHRRVRKTIHENGQVKNDTVFVYDSWNLIAELDLKNPSSTRTYVWGLDLSNTPQSAGGVGGLLAVKDVASQTSLHPAYDGNGNITTYVDASGKVTATREYDAFGNTIAAAGDANPPFGFSTKYTDAETGWLYYGYRYYAPELGRWVNRDPIGERGGLNIYGLVKNNAISFFDILGLASTYDPADSATWAHPKGIWIDGVFGQGRFLPAIGSGFEDLGVIQYKDGSPIFSEHPSAVIGGQVHVVIVEDWNGSANDSRKATRLLEAELPDGDYVWHHEEIVQTASGKQAIKMVLVPSHTNAIPHSGPASWRRAALQMGARATGILSTGALKCVKVLGVVSFLIDPVGAVAGGTTDFGDATISGAIARAVDNLQDIEDPEVYRQQITQLKEMWGGNMWLEHLAPLIDEQLNILNNTD